MLLDRFRGLLMSVRIQPGIRDGLAEALAQEKSIPSRAYSLRKVKDIDSISVQVLSSPIVTGRSATSVYRACLIDSLNPFLPLLAEQVLPAHHARMTKDYRHSVLHQRVLVFGVRFRDGHGQDFSHQSAEYGSKSPDMTILAGDTAGPVVKSGHADRKERGEGSMAHQLQNLSGSGVLVGFGAQGPGE